HAGLARDAAAILVLGRDLDWSPIQLLDLDPRWPDRRDDIDHASPRDHTLDRRQANPKGRAVAEQEIAQARDQLRRRHYGEHVARPPLFHQRWNYGDVERARRHEVLCQGGDEIWSHP